ncbi:hypothetical protein LIA77_03237 [Sarocladium implicatum]|nr:hypothetical protein LIA77_03237 [Sarocladium implicatum]
MLANLVEGQEQSNHTATICCSARLPKKGQTNKRKPTTEGARVLQSNSSRISSWRHEGLPLVLLDPPSQYGWLQCALDDPGWQNCGADPCDLTVHLGTTFSRPHEELPLPVSDTFLKGMSN